MGKRGAVGMSMETIIYILLCLSFFMGTLFFVNSYNHGSAFYEDFYSKEIANLINNARAGMELNIDVSKLAAIAIKNGKPIGKIIDVDNVNNQIIVSSRLNAGTSYGFFNDVDIVNWETKGPSGGAEATRFTFKIVEKQRELEV